MVLIQSNPSTVPLPPVTWYFTNQPQGSRQKGRSGFPPALCLVLDKVHGSPSIPGHLCRFSHSPFATRTPWSVSMKSLQNLAPFSHPVSITPPEKSVPKTGLEVTTATRDLSSRRHLELLQRSSEDPENMSKQEPIYGNRTWS